MRPIRAVFLALLTLAALTASCHRYPAPGDSAGLRRRLQWTPGCEVLVSAHRGGPGPGYAENSIATFEHSANQGVRLLELDVRKTSDGQFVLMHDATLDRTSTGHGEVAKHTLAEIRALRLKDPLGQVTDQLVPMAAEVLEWVTSRPDAPVLMVDMKPGVTPADIVELVRMHGAQGHVVVITYDAPTADTLHALDPDIQVSASAATPEAVAQVIARPWLSPVVFVGTRVPVPEVFERLHGAGLRANLGVLGDLDRRAEVEGDVLYRVWVEQGADVLATDRPAAVLEAVTPAGAPTH